MHVFLIVFLNNVIQLFDCTQPRKCEENSIQFNSVF